MSMIQVNHLTFAYDGSYDFIFEDVSFQMDTSWRLGLTGRNGKGKTTFLKLLCGGYDYQGTISASVQFDYFPFPVEDPEQLTLHIAEEIYPQCEQWQLQKELSLLELEDEVLYRPFATLSHGEQTKVLLAILFLRENHFLLIDEPTNHLDQYAREVVSNYLRRKSGFILVSHDRMFLDHCVDHILSINRSDIQLQQGNFSAWFQNKQYQDQFELAENERLQKDIRRLAEAAARTAKWSDAVEKTKKGTRNSGLRPDRGYLGHKAEKMMRRSKTAEERREKALEEKESLLKNIEKQEELKITPLRHHQRELVKAAELSLFYGEKQVCSGVSFSLSQGERVRLQGRNGCGKSSILKLLLGQEISFSGELYLASGLKISYVSQDTSFLKGGLMEYADQTGIDKTLFLAILRKLDFTRLQFEKDMEQFSQGQKKKVLLARSLCEQAHLYIWDEPFNFIDIFSRMQLEELILNSQPTMVFVEHDRAFAEKAATKAVTVES